MNAQKVAILGRWQPLHLGHQAALHALCERFPHVLVGVGSANMIDYRNPFSLDETRDMLRLGLEGYHNYELIPIPDTRDEEAWCAYVESAFAQTSCLISANPYVRALLSGRFELHHPVEFIPHEKQIPVSGTMVRKKLAQGEGWEAMLPPEIVDFLREKELDRRFREKFGLDILALETYIVE